MDAYDMLKAMLRNEGWKEQRDGEGYINGIVGTNYGRDGEVISISYNDGIDEEEWEELFGEA